MKYQLFVSRSAVNALKSPVTKINFCYGEITRESYCFVNKPNQHNICDINLFVISSLFTVKRTLMTFFDHIKYFSMFRKDKWPRTPI